MKRIFAVTYGGGHVNIIKSIYREVKKSPEVEMTILSLTMATEVLQREQIPCITISEIAKKLSCYEKIIKYGEKIALENHNPNSGIRYEDTIAYFGMGYLDLVDKYGENQAELIFKREGRKAFLPVKYMQEIIEVLEPDAILITTSPRMEEAAGIAGSNLNIPVIKISDLPIVNRCDYHCKICVMNEWAKDYAVKKENINPGDIFVTGQPVFEENLVVNNEIVEKYSKKLKRHFDKVITYLGQPRNPDTRMTIKILFEYAETHPNQLVIIRPHPNDDGINYHDTNNVLITKSGELKYIISISDLLITHYSTAGLEGALMGKQLITVLVDSNKEVRYSKMGIALEVNCFDDLQHKIFDCLNNCETQQRLKAGLKCFRNKANAANNIKKVIIQSIK